MEENENKRIEKEIVKTKNNEDKEKNRKIIKLILLIILIIIVIITSFKSGERFFEIKNSNFDNSYSKINSDVAKWCFDVTIKY